MNIFIQHTNKFILVAFCIMITACGATEKNLLKSTSQIAVDYRDALNDNNINTLIQLSALPVTFINQEWGSTPDGYGWMLGKLREQRQHLFPEPSMTALKLNFLGQKHYGIT